MHHIWKGEWPHNRSPRLISFRVDGKSAYDAVELDAGALYQAEVVVEDPEGDPISYVWEIKAESTDLGDGGDFESTPASIPGLIPDATSETISFTSPSTEGAYRIFVYAFDQNGNAAHANVPFFVGDH